MAATVPASTKITFSPSSASRSRREPARRSASPSSRRHRSNAQQFGDGQVQHAEGRRAGPAGGVRPEAGLGQPDPELRRRLGRGATPRRSARSTRDQQLVRPTRTSTSRTTVNNRLRLTGASGATLSDNRVHARRRPWPAPASACRRRRPGHARRLPPAGRSSGSTPDPIGDEEIINFNVPAVPVQRRGRTPRSGSTRTATSWSAAAPRRTTTAATCRPGRPRRAPNNLLAPFWTDLDGTGAPGVLVNVLTDGVDTWLVRRVAGQRLRDQRHLRSSRSGSASTGTQDISFAYDAANLPTDPTGQDYLVGAENAAGEGDVTRFLPTEDQCVTSTDPTPGDTVTYTVTVRGTTVGRGQRAHRDDRDGSEGRHDGGHAGHGHPLDLVVACSSVGEGRVGHHAAAQARRRPRARSCAAACRRPRRRPGRPGRAAASSSARSRRRPGRSRSSTSSRSSPSAQRYAAQAKPEVGLAQEVELVLPLERVELAPEPHHLGDRLA